MSIDNKTLRGIYLDKHVSVKWFQINPHDFLNNTITIYGRRNSGKSTLVIDIMYALKDMISIPFIISKTSKTNSDFYGIVPQKFIMNQIESEWLVKLLETQQVRCMLYEKGNNFGLLKSVFKILNDNKGLAIEKNIINKTNELINNIKKQELKHADELMKIENAKKIEKEHLISVYKASIRKYKTHLLTYENLTEDQVYCVNHIDLQPHILLVFDDCASVIKKWARDNPTIKEIFYNGRHYYITIIITAQDDKEIEPELRKNSIISIFTNVQAATSNFSKSANCYSKSDKLRASACIDIVFKNNEGNDFNYKKLVYMQNNDNNDPFRYTIATKHEPFRMGCAKLWTLSDQIEKNSNRTKNNEIKSFLRKYE